MTEKAATMTTIATCGGYELLEDGPRLVFANRGTSALSIALFVLGVLCLILGVNGVVQIIFALDGRGHMLAGLLLAGLSAATTAIFVVVLRAKRAQAARGLDSAAISLTIDRAAGALTDAHGRAFAPLEGAVFRSVFQVASSSRALEICYFGGTRVIARGSPFTGSIEGITEALRQRGFRVL